MSNWNYKREEQQFELIPEGAHRIRVKSVEKAQSKTGNDMLSMQFEVSGFKGTLYHYIVFLKDRPEITNRNLTQFFDSFAGIPEGNFNTEDWVGKTGACNIRHDEYNGKLTPRVNYFIKYGKYDNLPAWKTADGVAASTTDADGFVSIPEGADIDELF